MHLLFRAGRVLLFGKMILAEAFVTIRAAAQRFLIALMAASRRLHNFAVSSELVGVFHKKDPQSILSSEMRPANYYTLDELAMDYYSKSVLGHRAHA
jgi:hypothetical protein